MKNLNLKSFLSHSRADVEEAKHLLAVLNLGVVSALQNDLISTRDAEHMLYNGKSLLLFQDLPDDDPAFDILSRGAQIGDLSDALGEGEAAWELRRELSLLFNDSVTILRERQLKAQRGGPGSGSLSDVSEGPPEPVGATASPSRSRRTRK